MIVVSVQPSGGTYMTGEGRYNIHCATLLGETKFEAIAYEGVLTAMTPNGARVDGTYAKLDDGRSIACAITVVVPPQSSILTGLKTGPRSRSIEVRAILAIPPRGGQSFRFSIDVAGRAVDVLATFVGPVD